MQPRKVEITTRECNRAELNTLKLSGLTLTEAQFTPGSRTPPHTHDTASICLILTGQGVEIIDGRRVAMQPGCVIMRAPQIIQSDEYGAVPLRGLMIELDRKWLQTCRHFLSVFESYRHFPNGAVPALALRIYRELRIKDTVAPVIVEGLMLEMLGHASRSLVKMPVRPPGWLTEARDLLHGRVND
jgi:hypothetical protein